MTKTKKTIQVEIKNHPTSTDHKRVVVTTPRGYVFACSWAEPFPSEEIVRQAWATDRRDFTPFYG